MTTATVSHQRNPKMASNRTYLTVEEFCADLDISPSTFYDWRAKKKAPPCYKLPNRELRILRADYEDWMANLAERPA